MRSTSTRSTRWIVATLGVVVASVAWVSVMPWDFSTVRTTTGGREIERSGVELRHVLGTALFTAAGVALLARRWHARALSATVGAASALCGWYAFRAGTADTAGPNAWFGTLLLFVGPGSVVVTLAGAAFGVRWARAAGSAAEQERPDSP